VPSDRLLNREYSWLDFNGRVLQLAADPTQRLLERVKFLAIFSSNLDEFFQVRVAALGDQAAAQVPSRSPDGRWPQEQLDEISRRVTLLVADQERLWLDDLQPALQRLNVGLVSWQDLSHERRADLSTWFERQVFPVLTPLAVDPAHPFPYISSLSLNIAVLVNDPVTGEERFARVKVPATLPRLVPVPGDTRLVLFEEVIAAHLPVLFPGMNVAGHWCFRVTRNADSEQGDDGEAEDLLAAVELELRRRRFGRAVRLEVDRSMPNRVIELLCEELDLTLIDVSRHDGPLDLSALFRLAASGSVELKDEPWRMVVPARLAEAAENGRDMFSVIAEGDVLVHHPYDSFVSTVGEFVRQAAVDPATLSLKMTLYRTNGDSEIVRSLAHAAERGVQVVALVELKARFDEAANISWARMLEQAGAHVVYGLVGLKTHAKCVLVVRQEADGIRRYVHIGTGNYNASTARLYEDFGVFSAAPALADDLGQLFNHLTGYSRAPDYREIVVAPEHLRSRLLELIGKEAEHGAAGRILLKSNSVTDPEMIDALYAASAAGTQIDIIVRGISCLRPGVPGLSETIRVRSILGRNLEHSRVYMFAHGSNGEDPLWLVGSADLMGRNLNRRVEVLVPVTSEAHQRRIAAVLEAQLADDTGSWTLNADDQWHRISGGQVNAQQICRDLARAEARRLLDRESS
jgi:polyphosphate kinase